MALRPRSVGNFQQKATRTFNFPQTGVKATGTVTCATNAASTDGNTVTISDGFVTKTYEYDKSSNGVTSGNVSIAVGTSAASNATALAAAITATQPALTVVDDLAGTLTLTNRWVGSGGNVTITNSGAFAATHTGMSGGVDPCGSVLADTTIKLAKIAGRSQTVDRVYLNLPAGLAASSTDWCNFKLIKGASTVVANFSTRTTGAGGNGTITANTPVEMVITATFANRSLAVGDELSLFLDVTGSPTVPPGRIEVEGTEL